MWKTLFSFIKTLSKSPNGNSNKKFTFSKQLCQRDIFEQRLIGSHIRGVAQLKSFNSTDFSWTFSEGLEILIINVLLSSF